MKKFLNLHLIVFFVLIFADASYSQDSVNTPQLFIGMQGGAGFTFVWSSNEYNLYARENGDLINSSSHYSLGFHATYICNHWLGIIANIDYMNESVSGVFPALKYYNKYPVAVDLPRFKNLDDFDYNRKFAQPSIGPMFIINGNSDKPVHLSSILCFGFNLKETETYRYSAHNNYPYPPSSYFDPLTTTVSSSDFYLDRVLAALSIERRSPFIKKIIYFNIGSTVYFMPFYRSNKGRENLYNSRWAINMGLSYRFKQKK